VANGGQEDRVVATSDGPISSIQHDGGIVEIVVDAPPVNALSVAGWFALADAVVAAGKDPAWLEQNVGPRR
jgi:enoyl-CoA hydratase/carnithine racemase